MPHQGKKTTLSPSLGGLRRSSPRPRCSSRSARSPRRRNLRPSSHSDAHVCSKLRDGQARCTSVARAFYLHGPAYHARTESDLARAAARLRRPISTAPTSELRMASRRRATPRRSSRSSMPMTTRTPSRTSPGSATTRACRLIQNCSLAALTSLTSSSPSPCFTKTNQTGGSSLPPADAGWANEIDLDLQAASAVCPTCSILLLEANSSLVSNLGTAVTTASNTAARVGDLEQLRRLGRLPGEPGPSLRQRSQEGHRRHSPRPVTAGTASCSRPRPRTSSASAGRPCTSTRRAPGAPRRSGRAPAAAARPITPHPPGRTSPGDPCADKKAISDLSADADPGSGLAIYTTYGGVTGYWVFGGTSLSAPLVAALYAMQGGYGGPTLAGQVRLGREHAVFRRRFRVERVVQPGREMHRGSWLGRRRMKKSRRISPSPGFRRSSRSWTFQIRVRRTGAHA